MNNRPGDTGQVHWVDLHVHERAVFSIFTYVIIRVVNLTHLLDYLITPQINALNFF